ncbi:MAG: class I SAM-dependent methyltransferase [Halanaerobiales bacterium]
MSRGFFNERAEEWDQIVNHDPVKIRKVINDISLKSNNPAILDVGSGTGVLIPFFMEKYNTQVYITAVDFAENMINVSRKKHQHYDNIEYIVNDIYTLELPEWKYDLIICYSVFPHFSNKRLTLKRFRNWLKKDGLVVIFHSQSRKQINNLHKSSGIEVERDNLLPANEVAHIAEDLGYEVIKLIDNKEMYLVEVKICIE